MGAEAGQGAHRQDGERAQRGKARANAHLVWGEATNARAEKRTARIRTANGYSLTITGALAVVEHLMAARPAGGAYTPAKLMGADLVTRLPGSGPLRIVQE